MGKYLFGLLGRRVRTPEPKKPDGRKGDAAVGYWGCCFWGMLGKIQKAPLLPVDRIEASPLSQIGLSYSNQARIGSRVGVAIGSNRIPPQSKFLQLEQIFR